MKNFIILLLLLFVFNTSIYSQPEITSRLNNQIINSLKNDSFIITLIVLEDQLDILSLDKQLYEKNALPQERSKIVIESLQQKAKSTQSGLLAMLRSYSANEVKEIKSFWIINMLVIEAKTEVLIQLSDNKEIAKMDIGGKIILDSAKKEKLVAYKIPGSAEQGLRVINADMLWQMGYTGAGRIVMNIDTGVDGLHPALGWRWRGNHVPDSLAWFDPVNGTTFPSDGDNHGTGTMGVICGLDSSTQDTIGVAFGAEWIASNTLWGSPHTSYTIAAFQWAMDPDGDPNTINDMPDVINCSWYDPSVGICDQTYAMVFNAVEAAGIAIIFSAGAGGPAASSILKPANINTNVVNTWATGAVDATVPWFPIKTSSGRGPSQCYTGFTSLDIKPEACAPGVNIRTSVNNNSYNIYSGNSMATAHVSGAIALLKEVHPNLTGHEIKLALYHTAYDLGATGEDNTYGQGLIDVYAAYQYLSANYLNNPDITFPKRIKLYPNYPNPFNPTTTIKYDLFENSFINITIFTVAGKRVKTLINRIETPGYKKVIWNGINDSGEQVSTGIYIYRLEIKDITPSSASSFVQSRKMIFLK